MLSEEGEGGKECVRRPCTLKVSKRSMQPFASGTSYATVLIESARATVALLCYFCTCRSFFFLFMREIRDVEIYGRTVKWGRRKKRAIDDGGTSAACLLW